MAWRLKEVVGSGQWPGMIIIFGAVNKLTKERALRLLRLQLAEISLGSVLLYEATKKCDGLWLVLK